ncbi:hypothetical protein HanIR_Chr01g0032521 [Helianthus annuus]|nr:hypothetical protein HanIR_Chr01g0032521 [Helianthus annuus]
MYIQSPKQIDLLQRLNIISSITFLLTSSLIPSIFPFHRYKFRPPSKRFIIQ